MLIDLQLHSNYSDGKMTPSELAGFIAGQQVKVASLTDHNTVAGQEEFRRACRNKNIRPITGLELYVSLNHHRFNILWFNFDDNHPELHRLLRDTQIRRMNKARVMLEKLSAEGFSININKVLSKYNHYVSLNSLVSDFYKVPANRQRIRKELESRNPREGEIMQHYFFNKKIGLFNNSYVGLERVLALRKKIGGQIILNHPGKYGFLKMSIMEKMRKMGVDGLEVLSPHHSIGAVMHAQHIAHEYKFIMTGGSDFHRFEGNGRLIQDSWQYYKVDSKLLVGVEKII